MQRFWMFLLFSLFCLIAACKQSPANSNVLVVPQNPELNASLGKLFLAKNKLRTGVHTTQTGLQFSIINEGAGTKPTDNDLVSLFYQGRFIDGRVFDDQHTQKDPITIRVSAMIPGWQEAIKMMLPRSIWVLYIPPNLAYGERGVPNLIGPNQTLIYTVHLLSVKH